MGEKKEGGTLPGVAYEVTEKDAGRVLPERSSGELPRPKDEGVRLFDDLELAKEDGSGPRRTDGRVADGDAGIAMGEVRNRMAAAQKLATYLEDPDHDFAPFAGDVEFLECLLGYLREQQFQIGDRFYVLADVGDDDLLPFLMVDPPTVLLEPCVVEKVTVDEVVDETEAALSESEPAPDVKARQEASRMIDLHEVMNALVP